VLPGEVCHRAIMRSAKSRTRRAVIGSGRHLAFSERRLSLTVMVDRGRKIGHINPLPSLFKERLFVYLSRFGQHTPSAAAVGSASRHRPSLNRGQTGEL
jgi:hypothetical protein